MNSEVTPPCLDPGSAQDIETIQMNPTIVTPIQKLLSTYSGYHRVRA